MTPIYSTIVLYDMMNNYLAIVANEFSKVNESMSEVL